jgi:hypothetical protein
MGAGKVAPAPFKVVPATAAKGVARRPITKMFLSFIKIE